MSYLDSGPDGSQLSIDLGIDSDDDDPLNNLITSLSPDLTKLTHETPGIHSKSQLFTFTSFSVLVISPFFQGLTYGLGEGLGKICIGKWIGIDPVWALIGRMPKKERQSNIFTSFFARLFKKGVADPNNKLS
jgi:hypothetical protein